MENRYQQVKIWLLIALPVLAIAIGSGFAVHLAQVRRARLVVKVPTPVLPTPNAYDTFCRAGDALVSQAETFEVVKPQCPLAVQRRVLGENARALALLRQGLTQQYFHPPVRTSDVKFPYGKWRSLARLLKAESQVRAARGDWHGAAHSALECIHFGSTVPHGAPLIGTLVGIAMQTSGRDQLWHTVDQLSAPQARDAIKTLTLLSAHDVTAPTALQEELWSTYAMLQKEVLNADTSATESGDVPPAQRSRKVRQTMIDVYAEMMLKEIANSRLPYTRQQRLVNPRGPMAIAANEFVIDSRKFSCRFYGNQTGNRLLMVALALRAYRCEHDAYPNTLQALTPAYLTTLPADPFAARGAFHYRQRGASYVLYSVGPDGVDNGGTPISDPKHASHTTQRVTTESTGDIVAGVTVGASR